MAQRSDGDMKNRHNVEWLDFLGRGREEIELRKMKRESTSRKKKLPEEIQTKK